MAAANRKSRKLTDLRACIVLAVIVAIAIPPVAMMAGRSTATGTPTWLATCVAGLVCWFSASLSLVVAHHYRVVNAAMVGTFAGMLIRMAIPFGIGVLATARRGVLASQGFFGQLVVFFLLTLVVETCWSLMLVRTLHASKANARGAATKSAGEPHRA